MTEKEAEFFILLAGWEIDAYIKKFYKVNLYSFGKFQYLTIEEAFKIETSEEKKL